MKKILSILALALVTLTASAYDLVVGTSTVGTLTFQVEGQEVTVAEAGKVVTVTVTPQQGYSTKKVTAQAYASWGDRKGQRAPGMLNDIVVSGSGNEWTFTMPEANVEVSASYEISMPVPAEETKSEGEGESQAVNNVKVTVEVPDNQKPVTDPVTGITTIPVVAEGVEIPVQEGGTAEAPKEITIKLESITLVGNTEFVVTEVAADAFVSKEPTAVVTKVILPETETPLKIAEGAMQPNDTPIEVLSPLAMLDDYALMPTLKENFEVLKVTAVTKAPEKLWTFSSGVDVVLPEGLSAYIVMVNNGEINYVELTEEQLKLADGRRGIKANNGVLVGGEKDKDYEFVASPGHQKSGTQPATYDAKSYGEQNRLEPVIESKNYPAENYLVLKSNRFHTIRTNASKVKPCKAILRIK